MRQGLILIGVLAALLMPATAGASSSGSPTVERIQQDGLLRCGVVRAGPGVSETDDMGVWRGFFPDFCRVLAAAVLGDAEAVDFIEVSYTIRFEALNEGAFDVLMGNTTWTVSRDTDLGLAFTAPIYYDGQGFMAHKALGVRRLEDVGRTTVCVNSNTTTIRNLRELIVQRGLEMEIRAFDSVDILYDAFFARDCDLLTHDRIALTSVRLSRSPDPEDYVVFPNVVSKEPLGPVVRNDDENWFDVVQWALFATLLAEEHGISSNTLESRLDSQNPEVRRLLGIDAGVGASLGLPEDWARQIIGQVGNYAEIFARNLEPIGLDRGLNALWSDGGLLYPPPLR